MAKAKKAKQSAKAKKPAKKTSKEKLVGRVDHIFEKIQVVTTTLKSPLKVGDIIRIKGHTTDIVQAVDSIQIEHESVQKAKKGDGIGIKVKDFVRDNDAIYLADKKTTAAFRKSAVSNAPSMHPVAAVPRFVPIQRPVAPAARNIPPTAKDRPEQPKFFSF